MKKYIFTCLALSGLLMVSGCKQGNQLEEKKAELAKLKETLATTEARIKVLQLEVDKIEPKKANEAKIVPVVVTPVKEETFQHFIDVQGTVKAEDNLTVTPSAQGKIARVMVKVGQSVSKGQLLAVVDNSVLVQSIDEVKTQISLVNTLYDKQKALWDQKIGSEIQYLNAKTNKEALESKLETLKSQLALYNVIAPISGTVDGVGLKEGETPFPGTGVQIVNLSDLKVTAKLADSYIASIKIGDEVSVKLPDLGKTFTAKITFVGKVVDPISRTFNVEIAVSEGKEFFRPNMIAIVKINDRTENKALVVNENLTQNTEFGTIIFVAENEGNRKVAKMRKITYGFTYGGKVEIKEGLKAGDLLVTSGYQDLVDGTPISF